MVSPATSPLKLFYTNWRLQLFKRRPPRPLPPERQRRNLWPVRQRRPLREYWKAPPRRLVFTAIGNTYYAYRDPSLALRMTVGGGAPWSRSRPRPSTQHKKRAAVSCSSFCSYSSTGYTLTCLLSLPRRSKAILPSAVAKSVSSLPILTFRPGWRWVPL